MNTAIPLFWEANIFARHSFAIVTKETARALLRRPEIDLTLLPTVPHVLDSSLPEFAEIAPYCAQNKPPRVDGPKPVFVRLNFPLRPFPPPRATWVVYHPWEFTLAPTSAVEVMQRVREVWTTAQFCKDAFVRSGVPADKIHIVPNGVDLAIFHPDGAAAQLPGAKPFRFLFVGGTIFRKGVDALLEAYGRAFTSADPVSLVIKDYGAKGIYRNEAGSRLTAEFAQNPAHPHVLHLFDHRTDPEMAELFRACDVFVSSYRGEGFCLPALEAMACGRPVIVTRGGATDEFVDEQVGWRIPATLRFAGRTVLGMPMAGDAELLDPDVEALAELLREAFRNENERRTRGLAAAEQAKAWSWDNAADKIVTRCQALTQNG